MSFIETKHTRSRLNIIKKGLLKAVGIFSCLSMLAFLAYYIYLIVENIDEPFYLTIYSILIIAVISLFCIEMFIKEDRKLLRNEKRLSAEKKKKCKFIIKVFKYLAKSVLVIVAMYETVTNFDISISNAINICSAVLLIVQFVFEFIVNYVVKQIDYLRLSFELDIDESFAFKTFFSFFIKDKKLEEQAIADQGGSVYTPLEKKMIEEIKQDAKEFEKEKIKKKVEIRKLIAPKLEKLKFWKKWKKEKSE